MTDLHTPPENQPLAQQTNSPQPLSGQAQQQTTPTVGFEIAGRFDRWVAMILDNFFLGLIGIPVFFFFMLLTLGKVSFEKSELELVFSNWGFIITALVITLTYHIAFLIRDQATPGKKWRKLKIVNFADGSPLATWQVVVRSLILFLSYGEGLGAVLYLISGSMVMFSKNRQALHDLAAKSIVIKA